MQACLRDLAGSVPDYYNKANLKVTWGKQFSRFPSAGKLCLHHTLVSHVCNSIMSKKQHTHLNLKSTVLLKTTNHHLSFQPVIIFLLVEESYPDIDGSWLIRMVVAEGRSGCGNFFKNEREGVGRDKGRGVERILRLLHHAQHGAQCQAWFHHPQIWAKVKSWMPKLTEPPRRPMAIFLK